LLGIGADTTTSLARRARLSGRPSEAWNGAGHARRLPLVAVQEIPARPNVELRSDPERGELVVLAFPYREEIVNAVRKIPGRRFDWDTREWWAVCDDWVGAHVASVIERFPELTVADEASAWLTSLSSRWIGWVTAAKHDGRGWFVLETRAGTLPEALASRAVERAGREWLPLDAEVADALLDDLPGARLDGRAVGCANRLRERVAPARAALAAEAGVDGTRFRLDVLWDPDAGPAFAALPGAEPRTGTLPVDPYVVEPLDAFIATHEVEVGSAAAGLLAELREEHERARDAVRRSRATEAEPIDPMPQLGGTLEPFQWAGVRYVLDARRAFLADEQGLGKTVQALAALEADGAYPAIVVCPASLKLNWEREAHRWLPHRTIEVVAGRGRVPKRADVTILNYEIVAAHHEHLLRQRPRALVLDESHYCKNPQAKRTQAARRLANGIPADGLRLALTGTPVMNHPEELIPQLRIIGRLEEFGSGARFAHQFRHVGSEERLHWHLRRRCFVRRRKSEVLPQLPEKRRTIVPVELDNRREYKLAEEDVIAWLREQPLDLSELDGKIAAALRAERLAQLSALKRLAARGKLSSALAWIHDFLESDEPLVVFAHHAEVQAAVVQRFPDAAHVLGTDSVAARDEAVRAFQDPDGPQLIVCSTRVAGQGITLTRASNVAFLELDWTPAMHDQAEDRCHRMGQRDAVTAWYLLAANSIDETMAEVIERKRGLVAAVTDGRALDGDSLVQAVVKELRGRPFKRLRAVS
jgi:SWI/SNF-related matrix-associated actin-dependent regulator of chromatin subfamily A-like protein 1